MDPQLSVEDVMRRWPATIAVFARHRMACIGCPIGPFHSIADSSAEYDIPLSALLDELAAAVSPPPEAAPLGLRQCAPERERRGR